MSSNNIYELQHPDFIQNKYFYLYLKILSKPDTTGYTEKHHILPKSIGGSDSKTNLIQITSRKHFLVHYLLTKCVKQKTPSWYSMVKAFNMMSVTSPQHQRYINSKLYESNRKHMSATMSVLQAGENNSQHGSQWINNPTLQLSIRISKNENIPNGWQAGRIVNWDNHFTNKPCKVCNKIGCMSKNSDFCSKSCKSLHLSKVQHIDKDQFINKFIELKSLSATMKFFNVKLGSKSLWCKNTIMNSGNPEAIEIYKHRRIPPHNKH